MGKVQHDSETPAHGQQVISACAFVHSDFDGITKVFLPKRADTKKFLPGLYELPGGHIDFGEDLVAGLKREIMEEFEAEVIIGDPFAAFTYQNSIKGSHAVEVVYFAQFVGAPEDIKIHPEDHSGFAWFSRDEVIANRASIETTDPAIMQGREADPEYLNILRGFDLLDDSSALNFG